MKKERKPRIEFANLFNEQLLDAPLEVKEAFRDAFEIFYDDPNTKYLRNHPLDSLGKKYFGAWSIDVTGDWRALYRRDKNLIVFIELGTHIKLYG